MQKPAIAVHGGAGPDAEFIHQNIAGYEAGLRAANDAGYQILAKGGSALDAVEAAVKSLEDNSLFNAGRGSALNHKGEIEMDTSIMHGKDLKAGAVSMVRNIKNPVGLARVILEKTNHILLSDGGATELARNAGLELQPDSYFVTDYQLEEFLKAHDREFVQDLLQKRVHGTVGAVAADIQGNVAAATSTGGTPNSLSGRIGDSCLIGAGCYADNRSCAVSGTGDGEFLISGVIAHTIAFYKELKKCSVQEACDYVIHERNKDTEGDMGVISVDAEGNIGMAFNSEHMHRAWRSGGEAVQVKIYQG